jgi:hypothetical protein
MVLSVHSESRFVGIVFSLFLTDFLGPFATAAANDLADSTD